MLDVGCGVGGTSRYLARERGCNVTGLTISGEQVRMARKLAGGEEAVDAPTSLSSENPKAPGGGQVQFVELDAETMGDYFDGVGGKRGAGSFDAVWISEALSHFPNKKLFFENAYKVLKSGGGGKLVIADWFKKEDLTETEMEKDIRPIEGS